MAEQRKTTFNELKAYEARRRLAYSSKLDSISLYWKSYLDLIRAALSETGRAQRLVVGTCRAHQIYANAMKAMQDDVFLDEKGNIASEKLQKRLETLRQPKQEPKSSNRKSILSEIRTAQQTVAEKFRGNAKNMDEEIADAVTSLLDDVKRQFSVMEELGSAVLSQLEKTEAEVTVAWGLYLSKADGTAKSGGSSTPKSPQDAIANGGLLDTWVRLK
jgi:hypothetical protein